MATTEEIICKKPECTYAQTGECILGHDPLTCEDRLKSLDAYEEANIEELINSTILAPPEEVERFSGSFTLTAKYCETLMRDRYCKVVGILGVPGTGKTASLVSLYLLLAHSKLNGFEFRDSKSIMAFEEISKGARAWSKANLPGQLTVHTELQDERQAGYLHLRLLSAENNENVDLLLTDLPGEWTSSLIDSNRNDRLGFLKSSERIWVMINGEEIAKTTTRQLAIHRLEVLVDRVLSYLAPYSPSLSIVITHCDKNNGVKDHLKAFMIKYADIDIKPFEIASFSSSDAVNAGTGISELIKDLLAGRNYKITTLWQDSSIRDTDRQMLNYKNHTDNGN